MAATKTAAESTARRRALALLRSVLSPAEYHELMTHGCLTVPSPTRREITYRIPRGPGFVRVFEAGQPVVDLCVQPTACLPSDDVVLMHKVLIESDEAAYLATANRFPARPDRDSILHTIRDLMGDR